MGDAALTIKDVRNIAHANYHCGGDYVIEYLNDNDIMDFIRQGGTVKALFSLMNSYQEFRAYMRKGVFG